MRYQLAGKPHSPLQGPIGEQTSPSNRKRSRCTPTQKCGFWRQCSTSFFKLAPI
ncbi:hypothetical protein RTCIAT899_CH08300 [Rhizobium tropici CIAT 899]|nr:hypothetical protein RTCIAT899_CH08300 [Rhizobium tropici CIAT 899]